MSKIYDIQKEYTNISQYSPFCHVNEISTQYQKDPFMLPFIDKYSSTRPVHPDTFNDLGLQKEQIVSEKLVYPTSSFRTVFDAELNICYKLPVLRRITRSVRDLPHKELERSQKATELLSSYIFEGFHFLPEKCYFAEDPMFNYIERYMPETECIPWFYVISSQEFDADFEMKCACQIIRSWMFFASNGIFLESPHTQNILVDSDGDVYYRDLSDIRVWDDPILKPSFSEQLSGVGDLMSILFDRAVCNQNLDHLFRYSSKLGNKERIIIKELIASEIDKYNLPFPNYSMDFPKESAKRIPQKVDLVDWRRVG